MSRVTTAQSSRDTEAQSPRFKTSQYPRNTIDQSPGDTIAQSSRHEIAHSPKDTKPNVPETRQHRLQVVTAQLLNHSWAISSSCVHQRVHFFVQVGGPIATPACPYFVLKLDKMYDELIQSLVLRNITEQYQSLCFKGLSFSW